MAKPTAKFRAGPVSAAIWENEITVNGKKALMLKASIERRYKDKDGQWKSSNSFSRNEIPLAVYGREATGVFERIAAVEEGMGGVGMLSWWPPGTTGVWATGSHN